MISSERKKIAITKSGEKDNLYRTDWLISQANIQEKEGKIEEAIAFYLEAIELDKNQPALVYENAIILLEKVNEIDKGLHLGEQALIIHPKSDRIHQTIEVIYEKQQNLSANINGQENKEKIDDLHTQAVVKHKAGKIEEAIEIYLKLIELDENQFSWIYSNAITLLCQLKLIDKGLELGGKALKMYPDSDEIHRSLGLVYKGQDNESKSVEHYQTAIRLNPQQPDWLYCNLANQLMECSKVSQALKVIQAGIHQHPKSYILYYCLGEAFIKQGDLDQALKVFKDTRCLNPDSDDVKNKLNEVVSLKSYHSIQSSDNLAQVINLDQTEEIDKELDEQENLLCGYTENNFGDYNDVSDTFFGEILCISGNQIIGWIADENFAKKNITVKLLINGLEINSCQANLSKKHFKEKYIKNIKINSNKHCFFCLQIPDIILNNDGLHHIQILCPDNTILADIDNYFLSAQGNIDLLSNDRIAGWITDDNQDYSLELDLYIDGTKKQSFFADIERNDVNFGLRCGFDIHFPSAIYSGQQVELTLKNSKIPILDTPKQVITAIGSINILHKLNQATKNNLINFSEQEKQWVNYQLIPKLIAQFRVASKSSDQAIVNYPLNQVFSIYQQLVKTDKIVNVVVPVYKNYQVTKLCLESIIKSRKENKIPFNIHVIDDCSPDPQISIYLKDIAQQGLIQLLINQDNLGFVRSVNKGMKMNSDRDVILLNSDAIVNGNWIDRLRDLSYSQENIASVTPISNHASIFSYPFFAREIGELPNDTSLEELDGFCKAINQGVQVEVPSVHGFCCYLKQRALSEVGLFDEQKWEKGYGEEVDWSRRAMLLGWKHVAAPGIFVHHVGSQSFTERKHNAIARAQKILSSDYPEYDAEIQDFVTNDSLAPYRRRIDMARLKKRAPKYFLFISHDFGGGTKKYLADLSSRLAEEGYQTICLAPDQRNWTKLFSLKGIQFHSRYKLRDQSDFNALIKDLKSINVVHVHINSTIGFNQESILWQIPEKLSLAFDVTIHDYQFICPRINLTTVLNKYCGEPSAEACDLCITKNNTYNDPSLSNLYRELGSVAQWRNYYLEKIKKARKVFAPTYDVKERIIRYFPEVKIDVKYHPELDTEFTLQSYNSQSKSSLPFRVALIGAISDIKGYQILQECASYAINFNIPLEFVVFGYTKDDALLLEEYPNIHIMGIFKNLDDLKEKLSTYPCDIVAFLSIWPETYSYTLSEALSLSLIPMGLNIGAIGERIKNIPGGVVLQPYLPPKKIVIKMIELCQFARKNRLICNSKESYNYKSIIDDYYQLNKTKLSVITNE
ncbi:putative glycosyltransferase [Xenococcus sp. PCC 7305]|uniref:glycosyltransferase n=1 Tax=Xenococcus sp. PCC 7305 TaxID=102125 RepID=UPI0002ABD137|nr:glycosyltransferase [Xenococcus sp. PCC 7305]ELS02765.1 putative glycosyltransferase [Xenococcus sp. PCC 7305]